MWDVQNNNKQPRYQVISNCKSSFTNISWMTGQICILELALESAYQTISNDI